MSKFYCFTKSTNKLVVNCELIEYAEIDKNEINIHFKDEQCSTAEFDSIIEAKNAFDDFIGWIKI